MKFAGAGIIIFSCWYIGNMTAKNELDSFGQLCGVIRLLEYFEQRITFSRERLGSVFADFSDSALEKCGFMEILRDPRGEAYQVIWEKACASLSVAQTAETELINFGNGLGRLDLATQKERIALCRGLLTAEKNRSEPGLAARVKSGRTLGALTGALIAIILL